MLSFLQIWSASALAVGAGAALVIHPGMHRMTHVRQDMERLPAAPAREEVTFF